MVVFDNFCVSYYNINVKFCVYICVIPCFPVEYIHKVNSIYRFGFSVGTPRSWEDRAGSYLSGAGSGRLEAREPTNILYVAVKFPQNETDQEF